MRAPRCILLVLHLALVGTTACDRATTPSSPGKVVSTLVSPFADDGAALIEFTGDVQSVTAPAGTTAYLESRAAGVVRVLLVRETPGKFEFTLGLANRSRLPSARVLEISDAADVPRTDISAYRVEY